MADKDGNKHAKNFGFDQPAENKSFHVKGMERRLGYENTPIPDL